MKLNKTLSALIAFLLVITIGYSTQDFSINTNSVSATLETGDSSSAEIVFTNTGNESITLNIDVIDPQDGINKINLVSSSSQITLENESETQTILINYSAGVNPGNFVGLINVTNSINSSQYSVIDFEINVNQGDLEEPSLVFIEDEELVTISGDRIIFSELLVDDIEDFDLILKNNGNETLTDITFEIENLEGDEDDIDDSDIQLNGDNVDDLEIDELVPGEEDDIEFEFDIGSIEIDTYSGDLEITATTQSGSTYKKTYKIEVETYTDDEDITFGNPSPIKLIVEAGETIDNIDLEIVNDGVNEVKDLILEVKEDLEQETGSAILDLSVITFEKTGRFDVRDEDEEEIEMEVTIPEGTTQGTYIGEIRVLNKDDKELDTIKVEIKVVGDIYIEELTLPDTSKPGESVDLEITLKNDGSTIYRDVRIDAIIEDVDLAQSDLDQTSGTFLLDTNSEVTKRLRFNLPEDATDGAKTVEITITYGDDQELVEIESISIVRESYNIDVKSYSISPNSIVCEDYVYTNVRVENLGKYDDEVTVISKIEGTSVSAVSNEIELSVDDDYSFRNTLDVSSLEAGVYTVVHTVKGNNEVEVENTLRIQDCGTQGSTTIELEELNETQFSQVNETTENTVEVFGKEVEQTTAYIGGALVVIILLIIVSLFML